MAAMSSLRSSNASRTYYERKRAEGKTHIQAVLSLARRRLWRRLWGCPVPSECNSSLWGSVFEVQQPL